MAQAKPKPQISTSKVSLPKNILTAFGQRCENIKNEWPDLFFKTEELSIRPSESYSNRIKKILAANATRSVEPSPHEKLNKALFINLVEVLKNPKRAQAIAKLPIYAHKDQILQTIANNQVVLIRGATGCGKTTQVPQYILDSYIQAGRGTDCRIVCTQPRRVACISIASRVAEERREELGGASVGFQIRCENETVRPEGGHILYCTVGVLLRLQQNDPTLKKWTHIIVDEIHERQMDSDIFLAALKILLPSRPDLRVIIMSATIEMDQFSNYFGGCPTMEVTGYNYRVDEFYLGDIMRLVNMPLNKREQKKPDMMASLVSKLIEHIHTKMSPGAILVFCSGYEEIQKLYISLKRTKDKSMKIYILHSLVPVRKDKIFIAARDGERKIILSTNVAESSITVNDVAYVIDNGRSKVLSYTNKSSINALQNNWITKANAAQRKGRAGRCRDGIVYRLYDKEIYDLMEDYVRPDITRERLDGIILDLMVWNFGPIREFFASLVSPPKEESIVSALQDLADSGAINQDEKLTSFGRTLSNLHLDPSIGKMMIYSAIFNCVDPITSVAAFLSYKDVFMLPLGNKKARRELKALAASGEPTGEAEVEHLSNIMEVQLDFDGDMCSDHMARIKVVQEFQVAKRDTRSEFCYENYLNESTMVQVMSMRKNILGAMVRNQFISTAQVAAQENNLRTRTDYLHMIRSVICAGLYPNVAALIPTTVKDKKGKEIVENLLFTAAGREMQFHQGSVNSSRKKFDTPYLVYHKAISTNKVYLHDTTMVHSLALLIFANEIEYEEKTIIVDQFIQIECAPETITLVRNVRMAMHNIFVKTLNKPNKGSYTAAEDDVLQLIADILALEEYTP